VPRRAEGQIISYQGARGERFRARYRDASGKRVCETLHGVATYREAERRLAEILVDVRREGRKKLEPVTFAKFAREWLDTYPDSKDLKYSTVEGYDGTIEKHLIPALGEKRLDSIDVAAIERYVAQKQKEVRPDERVGYAPRTLNHHLNLLHLLFKAAERRGLVRGNPVAAVERPRKSRRRWAILSPVEIGRVARAFDELIDQAEDEAERTWRGQARVVFMTVIGAGLRRGEILGLRWRHVFLADPESPRLEVRETFVRGRTDTPKSEKSERTISLDQALAGELMDHRGRSPFSGDDERVFCSQTGGAIDPKRYADTLRLALAKAKIEQPVRPFHDGRHTSITNGAAEGLSPGALMARAGHSDLATTQLYIDLAGEAFREEAERLGARVFAHVRHNSGHK
jgi:integrase